MNSLLKLIARLQSVITRFRARRAPFLLREDYNNSPMQEFAATLNADEFLDYG